MKQATQQFLVRLPVDVHAALKAEASKQDRSINWLVSRLLSAEVAKLQATTSEVEQ